MNSFITTKSAAERLNISVRRVQALIASGKLPAEKVGNCFVIKGADLKKLGGRKNGRPSNGTKSLEKDWSSLIRKYAGCLKDLPPDLSTNSKYLEGFGE